MNVVVPGMKIGSMELITDRADVGCDAEIAEPRSSGGGGNPRPRTHEEFCLASGYLRW